MNFYPFHIGDFRSGTVNMSRQSRWIYRDMLDVYYDTEHPLTADIERLCDEIGVETEEEIRIVNRLLRFKFELREDGYHHPICDRVIDEYRTKADTAKKNGKRGGRPSTKTKTQDNPVGFDSVSTANQQQTGSKTNQEPITNNQEIKRAHVEHHQALPEPPDGPDGPARTPVDEPKPPGDAAAAAMRAAGLADASATHPQLRAALAQGMTVPELASAAADAAARGKGFPWALARAQGRRADAAALAVLPAPPPGGAADPDSRAAIEADGERLGLGRWEQLDAAGKTVPWAAYAARVKARRSELAGATA